MQLSRGLVSLPDVLDEILNLLAIKFIHSLDLACRVLDLRDLLMALLNLRSQSSFTQQLLIVLEDLLPILLEHLAYEELAIAYLTDVTVFPSLTPWEHASLRAALRTIGFRAKGTIYKQIRIRKGPLILFGTYHNFVSL